MCTTWRVAAASRPRHKPSRAGGGADWRIPLRIGPALDRRRVLAGSGARHRRGGAARGFIPRRQYLGGLASPRSLSPEASSSMGGSYRVRPYPLWRGGAMPRWGGPGPLAVKPREGLGQKPSGLGDAKPAYYIEKLILLLLLLGERDVIRSVIKLHVTLWICKHIMQT